MKESDNFKEETIREEKAKPKQKAGLNSIRPSDYVEEQFKKMAKEKKLSQTEMFYRIFWNYIRDEENERKQLALNLESEISLISKDLGNILQHFKSITDKAQNTIISIKSNAEQTQNNLSTDINTLQSKLDELTKRNVELELFNSTFNEVKTNLEFQVLEMAENINKKDNELKEAKEIIKAKDKSIKDLEKNIDLMEKNADKSDQEIHRLKMDVNSLETKVRRLESTNDSLSDTINSIDSLKKSEISSIESKFKLIVEELELKLSRFEELKVKEIERIQNNIISQYEADKTMAIAESKLELADLKSKYGETLIENTNLKNLLEVK